MSSTSAPAFTSPTPPPQAEVPGTRRRVCRNGTSIASCARPNARAATKRSSAVTKSPDDVEAKVPSAANEPKTCRARVRTPTA
ncbi:MAG TPA: hypothetical protein VHJ20_12980 [Polyangia bacterium]|nr:hypothetical protein [Polyangia bacterium]